MDKYYHGIIQNNQVINFVYKVITRYYPAMVRPSYKLCIQGNW